ncbi:MAG TPA: YfiR/HmsC family protein [Minicystis sp.]|nr:YfiR/HmsC family protein [Minicystis sp.]
MAVFAFGRSLVADEVAVPVPLQMQLLAKVAGYDRNLPARAGDRVHVLVVTRPGNVESARVAAQAESALADVESIGGLPHDQTTSAYADAPALARLVRARRISIVYLTPGFGDADVEAIAAALSGGDVLSASAVAATVPHGVVLGFDLVSGKPKLLVHLGQARRQHVDLSAEVLKLMRVVD